MCIYINERIHTRGEICPHMFSAIPWKLHIFLILERMFYDGLHIHNKAVVFR
jgi:hypothetical protein